MAAVRGISDRSGPVRTDGAPMRIAGRLHEAGPSAVAADLHRHRGGKGTKLSSVERTVGRWASGERVPSREDLDEILDAINATERDAWLADRDADDAARRARAVVPPAPKPDPAPVEQVGTAPSRAERDLDAEVARLARCAQAAFAPCVQSAVVAGAAGLPRWEQAIRLVPPALMEALERAIAREGLQAIAWARRDDAFEGRSPGWLHPACPVLHTLEKDASSVRLADESVRPADERQEATNIIVRCLDRYARYYGDPK